MTKSDVYERAFLFACRVLDMERALSSRSKAPRSAFNQLIRAATSVGANLEEAKAAQSKAEFHAKVRISLKEARESHYWLRLFYTTRFVQPKRLESLLQEANEIVSILTVIARKANPHAP